MSTLWEDYKEKHGDDYTEFVGEIVNTFFAVSEMMIEQQDYDELKFKSNIIEVMVKKI